MLVNKTYFSLLVPKPRLFLVPKPQLGNASAPEAPASGGFMRSRGFSNKCVPKLGLGNKKETGLGNKKETGLGNKNEISFQHSGEKIKDGFFHRQFFICPDSFEIL
jgi:hypothetical protein